MISAYDRWVTTDPRDYGEECPECEGSCHPVDVDCHGGHEVWACLAVWVLDSNGDRDVRVCRSE